MSRFQIIGGIILTAFVLFFIWINNYMDSKNRRFKPSDSYSEQYLHLAEAIYKDKARRVKKIIKEEGLDVNFTDEKCGYTPLLYAIRNHSYSVVETLLKLGADPNKGGCIPSGKDTFFRYPLSQAVYTQNTTLLTSLLNSGADPNLGDPLSFIIQAGNEDIRESMIKLLVIYGADINHIDSRGRTPLEIAAGRSRYDLVNYLLDSGADPLIKNKEGETIIENMQRCYKVHSNKEAFLNYLSPTLHRLRRRGIEVELEE